MVSRHLVLPSKGPMEVGCTLGEEERARVQPGPPQPGSVTSG